MNEKHKKVKSFYDYDSERYLKIQWTRNDIAKFNYEITKKRLLDNLSPSKKDIILEIGCGPGTWTKIVSEKCGKLTAIDISKGMIEKAKKYVNKENINFVTEDFTTHKFNKKFNKIFSVRAIEYIKDKNVFIDKCYKLVDNNGKLIIITKHSRSIWELKGISRKILKKLTPNLFRYDLKEKVSYSNLWWEKRINAYELQSSMKKSGFKNIKITPVMARPPIFMRGKFEIPLIPPSHDKVFVDFFRKLDNLCSKSKFFLVISESYLITGIKSEGG